MDTPSKDAPAGDVDSRKALSAAKLAVRSYTKDPSERNAARVQAAWLDVRVIRSRAVARKISRTWARRAKKA